MKVIVREWYDVKRSDIFQIVPIGDVHIGAAACDEDRLKDVVEYIRVRQNAYWIGMGDYVDAINRTDPRFDPSTLADWVKVSHLVDLAKAQRDRFLEIVSPIADKCLGLICGNHESAVKKYYERDVYYEIVSRIKEIAQAQENLALGYNGWLILRFYRGKKKEGAHTIKINAHHGFTGGRLAGAKALNMQRWLWVHDCDIAIFGHSHNTSIQPEAVVYVDDANVVRQKVRIGVYSGTFLRSNVSGITTYSEAKGYLPLPVGGVIIWLKPATKKREDRITISTRVIP